MLLFGTVDSAAACVFFLILLNNSWLCVTQYLRFFLSIPHLSCEGRAEAGGEKKDGRVSRVIYNKRKCLCPIGKIQLPPPFLLLIPPWPSKSSSFFNQPSTEKKPREREREQHLADVARLVYLSSFAPASSLFSILRHHPTTLFL